MRLRWEDGRLFGGDKYFKEVDADSGYDGNGRVSLGGLGMSGNFYDQGSRYLAKQEPEAFLAWLLGLSPDRFAFRGWIDARRVRFPGEPDRTCDTVAFLENLAAGSEPWALPVEFQIEPDVDMFPRMLGYLEALGQEKRPSETRGDRFRLGAVVVNLRGEGDCSRDMRWPEAGLVTQLGVCERNLAGLDAASTLDDIEAGRAPAIVLPLIPLMQRGGDEGIIQRWVAMAIAEPDARRRGDYGGWRWSSRKRAIVTRRGRRLWRGGT